VNIIGCCIKLSRKREHGLRDRPRAENQNIHQSFCALLPIWPRRHVGNADQSSEQVEWIEVRADLAAFDRALHQSIAPLI
jgi:hypothetical protein